MAEQKVSFSLRKEENGLVGSLYGSVSCNISSVT
jgi:hypothetical protein